MNVYGVLSGTLTSAQTLSGSLTIPTSAGITRYVGPYEFTPADEAQTIEIDHEMATANIVINPIPSNYGKITWDGSTITVS